VVSLLPGNVPPGPGEDALYQGVSKDGNVVAFMINGTLYARLDNAETLDIGSGNPEFGGLSDTGRYLVYVSEGVIHRVDTVTKSDIAVNPGSEGKIVNVSADGSHIYFISNQQLDGSEGSPGQPNMYVWGGASAKFIATVAASDLVRTSGSLLAALPALTRWTVGVQQPWPELEAGPGADSSRTTPDGRVIAFESRAQLTDYDNANPAKCPSWTNAGPDEKFGTADDVLLNTEGRCTEIYRFDEVDNELQCVSCDPAGSSPAGDARFQEVSQISPPTVIHNLSSDGGRVFFETSGALVDGDDDGLNDIYEWEPGGIDAGDLHLISSGKTQRYPLPEELLQEEGATGINFLPNPNVLMSITPNGNDVFFVTQEALVNGAGEGGVDAVYDARVGGGFAELEAPKLCAEEDCRGATRAGEASEVKSRPSETNAGKGNVKPRHARCHRSGSRRSPRRRHQPCRHKKRAKQQKNAQTSNVDISTENYEGSGPAAHPAGAAGLEGGGLPEDNPRAFQSTSVSADEHFGFQRFEGQLSPPADAGAPTDFTVSFEFNHFNEHGVAGHETSSEAAKSISFSLPPGLVGDPGGFPTCDTGALVSFGNCPTDAQVGIARVRVGRPLFTAAVEPIYNLKPPHPEDEIARLGFLAYFYPIFIDLKVRTNGDYGVTATVQGAPGLAPIVRAKTTLWANPTSSSHDEERLKPIEEVNCENAADCKVPGGRPSTIPLAARKTFMTNPSACQEMPLSGEVVTYQHPDELTYASILMAPIVNCTGLPFAPEFEADPTSHAAGVPTGLKTVLKIPQHLKPEERASATMREARVTLPAGMQVAAGAANWIGTCSEEQIGYHQEVDAACPDNSKLGTATFISPALATPIQGTIYQREPRPGHQLGLWLASDALGMHIKLPGDLESDPATGRVSAVFHDLPQVPVEEIDLDVWGGPRAPLQNPDHCGTFTTNYTFSPHSDDPPVSGASQMKIDEGCNQAFSPNLRAGVTSPVAGGFSPLVVDLGREDGEQALRGFKLHLPDGELARLAGVPLCPDPAAATGSCPAGSRIGSLSAVTGPGPEPLQVPQPGKPQPAIYLAGPYQGAPYSIVSEVPAQAGPFDLGVLAVRSGLEIDPETARATVNADPLPQFFEGVGISYRHLHAVIDRPEFSLNPTDCRETQITSDITSTQGAVAHPATRFEVDGCNALKFKPSLSLAESGGPKEMRRTGNPQLTAVLRARRGDANIAATTVLLPHSQFIDQAHISNPCTRVQYNENGGAGGGCPKRSVLGTVEATTPLLDQPLKGKVYFRSNGGDRELPDVVLSLDGPIHIEQVGFVDSRHGRIRTRFASIPDAPLSKVTIRFFGGKRSLLENSTNLCSRIQKARVTLAAQNGRGRTVNSTITTSCGNHSGSG